MCTEKISPREYAEHALVIRDIDHDQSPDFFGHHMIGRVAKRVGGGNHCGCAA